MWKYTHTDEMYHSLTSHNDELFHSAVYLGQDFSDGIRHFKYIKREKINGKWVYTYKDDKLAESKKVRDEALNTLQYENKKRGYGNNNHAYLRYKGKDVNDPTYNKLKNDAGIKSLEYARNEYRSNKRKKRYSGTINFLNKTADVHYKAKNKVKDIINQAKKKKKNKKKQAGKKTLA